MRRRFKVGSKVCMTEDALENYGQKYRDKIFIVEHVATKYMPVKDFYALGKPVGYHPGFDDGGAALYDLEGFDNSLYDWELEPA